MHFNIILFCICYKYFILLVQYSPFCFQILIYSAIQFECLFPIVQQVQAQEMAADDDIPPEDPVQFRVVDLRKMVVREVKKDGKEI